MTRLWDIGTTIRALMPRCVKNAIIDRAQRQMVPLSFKRIGYQLPDPKPLAMIREIRRT